MNSSSDFMMYLHEDKVQRMRQYAWVETPHIEEKTNAGLHSPFSRVRSVISTWVNHSRNRR